MDPKYGAPGLLWAYPVKLSAFHFTQRGTQIYFHSFQQIKLESLHAILWRYSYICGTMYMRPYCNKTVV